MTTKTNFHQKNWDSIRKAIVTTAAAPLFIASFPTYSQESEDIKSADNDSPVLESIVVTGIRRSLTEARDLKRTTNQFIDAVVAEDIGKLPDNNVAESLQRVSGIQLDRGIGEGTSVSIRGIRNNVVLLNGREIFDAGGRGGQGPDTLGTSTYGLLSLVPSELISRLEVTKLAGADEIEGAIGGTINIVTAKPLDSPGFRASGSVGTRYGDLSGEANPKASFLVSNTFADDTFGISLSGSYSDNNYREDGFNTFSGYTRLENGLNFTDLNSFNAVTGPDGLLLNPDPNGDGVNGIVHQDPRYWQINDGRERTGFNLNAQWLPNEAMELNYDVLYSKVESQRDRYWLGVFVPFGRIENAVLSDNEVLISGISNRPQQTNVEYADFESEVVSQALTFNWDISENIRLNTELAMSSSESTTHQNFFRLQATERPPLPFSFVPEIPEFGFNGGLLSDIDSLLLTILFDSRSGSETDNTALSLDFDHYINDGLNLEYGARYSKVETAFTSDTVDLRPNTPAAGLSQFISTWSSPDFFAGEAPSVPRSYLVGSNVLRSAGGGCAALESFYLNNPDPAQRDAYLNGGNPGLGCGTHAAETDTVEEEFQAIYAKLNFTSELGSIPVSGNVGVRYLNRDLTSTGTLLLEGSPPQPFVTKKDDSTVLPSAVVKFDLNDNLVARAGYAKVLSYPSSGSLRNNLTLFGSGDGFGGSPELDPFEADQFDLSLEYYFSEDALLSVAYFKKEIDSFVIQQTDREVIPNFVNPDDGSNLGLISRGVNGDGGSVDGIELSYQQSFSTLPAPLDGLGIQATYTNISSDTPFTDPSGRVLPQPGLSENNINAVLYWEKGPLGARLAYNWRDEYLDRLGFSGSGIFADSYDDLVFSAYYDINDRFTVSFEATNLLDTRLKLFNTSTEATRSIVEFGPSYALTLRGSL